MRQSLWQSSLGEALEKASKGVGIPGKEHHQGFRLGWIELAQRLQEGPEHL